MPTPKALHSKATPRWGTPQHIIEAARTLMGGIHLDPASSEEFNAFVKALMIYRQQDNGLAPECAWAGNVFCNPPGGLVREFWDKLCLSYMNGEVEKAFWVGFSVEQLATLANCQTHPMDYSFVILRKRLNFNQQKTVNGSEIIEEGTSPSHSNYLCAMGCDKKEFERLFRQYGKIIHGPHAKDL